MIRRLVLALAVALAPVCAEAVPTGTIPVYTAPATPVTQRAPAATDDSAHGRNVGDIWLLPNGTTAQALSVTPGSAVWGPTSAGLPLDVAPTAQGAYGPYLMSGVYSGSDFILTRGSDGTTLTIGFIDYGPATAAADNFCNAKGDLAANTCYVTTIKDQSGNGYDCTQSTVGNAPLWTMNLVNGRRAISFNTPGQPAAATMKFCTLPTGLQFAAPTGSMLVIAAPKTSAQTNEYATFGANQALFYGTGYAGIGSLQMQANTIALPIAAQAAPTISLFAAVASASHTFYDGNRFANSTSTGFGGGTQSGGSIGSAATAQAGDFDMVGMVIWNRYLTVAEQVSVRASAVQLSGIAPQIQDVWDQDGDSKLYGLTSVLMRSYGRLAQPLLNYPVQVINSGYSGIQLGSPGSTGTKMANFAFDYGSNVYQAAAPHFVVSVDLCINDILNNSDNGTTCYNNLVTYAGKLHALGPNVRVIVSTLEANNNLSASQATARTTFNGLVQANWRTFADGLMDFASDPVLGQTSTFANTSLSSDGTHPLDALYPYYLPIVTTALNGALSR